MVQQKSKKKSTASKKRETVPVIPKQKPPSMLEPYRPFDLWMEFDRVFERFRRDFEDFL